MRKLTQTALKQILTDGLRLKEPLFRLESYGGQLVGSVISETFFRKRDLQRQRMIWDVLEGALGENATKLVGMILAYTPDEWGFDETDDSMRPTKAKAPSRRASIMNRAGS